MILTCKLQGGPFDGDRAGLDLEAGHEPPERLYVRVCDTCREPHWYTRPQPRAEVYRYDDDRGDYHLYVFTDESLDDGATLQERELVPAGAGHDEPLGSFEMSFTNRVEPRYGRLLPERPIPSRGTFHWP